MFYPLLLVNIEINIFASDWKKINRQLFVGLFFREFSQALVRLTKMIRGMGDPLVAVYARTYICRVSRNNGRQNLGLKSQGILCTEIWDSDLW